MRVFPSATGQEPVRIRTGHFDEAQDCRCGNGATVFVVAPCSKRYLESLSNQGATVLSIKLLANLANPPRETTLYGHPVRVPNRLIHRESSSIREC